MITERIEFRVTKKMLAEFDVIANELEFSRAEYIRRIMQEEIFKHKYVDNNNHRCWK